MRETQETYARLIGEHKVERCSVRTGTSTSYNYSLQTERIVEPASLAYLKDHLNQLEIVSHREGMVPGIHRVTYTSADDFLEINHSIINRRALAMGAVIAGEYLNGKSGVHTMDDLL